MYMLTVYTPCCSVLYFSLVSSSFGDEVVTCKCSV